MVGNDPFFPGWHSPGLRVFGFTRSHHPPRSSLMGTNGSTPETKKLKKHADGDLLHRVDSCNLTTSKSKQPPAFQSLANIRINYCTTVVVSTVAGFQPSTLLHFPSCFFKFCDTCVLDPATIWPFEFVAFFDISHNEFSFGKPLPSHAPSSLW